MHHQQTTTVVQLVLYIFILKHLECIINTSNTYVIIQMQKEAQQYQLNYLSSSKGLKK